MDIPVLISRMISVIYISAGIAVLAGTLKMNVVIRGLDESPALSFIAGAAGIAAGISIVSIHNIWANEWTVLVTLIGWCFLLGGITVVIYPKILSKMNFSILSLRIYGLPMIGLGMLFGYFGFMGAM